MGKFPVNYLLKVDIPVVDESASLFVSIVPFRGEQPGDLSFGKGNYLLLKVIPIIQTEVTNYTCIRIVICYSRSILKFTLVFIILHEIYF